MKTVELERLDWTSVVIAILVIGFVLVTVAGQMALRFSPEWELKRSMDSHIDPNSAYLTRRPAGLIEPIDAAILTQPAWIPNFLTPGATVPAPEQAASPARG